MKVYLDNAATTAIDKQVIEAMLPFMENHYGNPSSIHAHGRETRAAIEKSRKTVANLLNASPAEIFFTSGGTEADNFAIFSSLDTFQIQYAITSRMEHHAVLHTLEYLQKIGKIQLKYIENDQKGNINLAHLEDMLKNQPRTLVSLMHANNEIGNIYDIQKIGEICKTYQAVFHSDTVQTMGSYSHNLQEIPVDFIVGAAHKFHGPKGIGFIYLNSQTKIHPLIHGGGQERNMRAGTENIYGIVGLAKALELAYQNMNENRLYIEDLKNYMIEKLKASFEDVIFNGESANLEKSSYKVLNVGFPPSEINDMLLFTLDIHQISVSGGSACSSGSSIGSHVLQALDFPNDRAAIRFSFSKYNTKEEIDYVISKLQEIFKKEDVQSLV